MLKRRKQRYGQYVDYKNHEENKCWLLNILDKIEEESEAHKFECKKCINFKKQWFSLEEENPDNFSE